MKQFIISILALPIVFFTVGSAFANDLNVYPIQAVFVSSALKNTEFTKVFQSNRDKFIARYLKTLSKYFPKNSTEITDKTKYKTFAAYVHVPRAAEYVVDKGNDLVDIYLPLTMSINFTNMTTGEILYSYPITNYFKYETTAFNSTKAVSEKIKELYKENYEQTLDEIIAQASKEFKPLSITTKIIDNYRNFYILDKGLNTGITKGDMLVDEAVNQLNVIYSDLDYSVAVKALGNPISGNEYSKFTTQSITQIKKPKVLFINDFSNEKIYSLFSNALGSNAPFSLINTDKTYYDMQSVLVSLNINFKNANTNNRALPDYFLKLYFTPPLYTQYRSNKDYLNIDKYSMIACGIIFDKTGRVVYSKCTDDEIVNKVIGNVRFNDEANFEILTKNLFEKLATAIQADVKFKDVKFKIIKTDNQFITLDDPDGYLKTGSILTVFKTVKTEKSGSEIVVPTYEYRVMYSDKGHAEAKMMYPIADGQQYPSKKDTIKLSLSSRTANKANMYNYVCDNQEIEGNEVHLNFFNTIAFSALASSLKAPVSIEKNHFLEQLKELNAQGFKENIDISENNSNLTIKTVYQIKAMDEKLKGPVIEKSYNIIVGIVVKKDEKTVKQDGLQQTVTITVPRKNNEAVIEYELMKNIYPLIQQIGAKF